MPATGNRAASSEEWASPSNNWWNASWWTNNSWWESSRWTWAGDCCGFRTQVVATTVCATECVHTLCCRTRIFSAWRADITHTHGSRICKKVCCTVHVVSLRIALSTLMFRPPSLLFPDGHFSCSTSLPSLTRTKIAGHAHSCTSGEEFVYMADSAHFICSRTRRSTVCSATNC